MRFSRIPHISGNGIHSQCQTPFRTGPSRYAWWRSTVQTWYLNDGRIFVDPVRPRRQHLETVVSDRHHMLPLGREGLILGDHGPAVAQGFHMPLPGVEHRFNGENHPGFQCQPLTRIAVMQDLWFIVIDLADTMAAVLTDHTEAVTLGNALNRVTNVTQRRAGTDHANTGAHGFIRGLDQTSSLRARFADEVHAAGVAVPAILDHGNVDIDDIAVLQRLGRRNAVANHLVDRGTHGFREAVITDITGNGLLHVDDVIVAKLIQLVGGDPRLDVGRDHGQHLGGQFARRAGQGYFRLGIDLDAGFHCWAPGAAWTWEPWERSASAHSCFKSRPPASSARISKRLMSR